MGTSIRSYPYTVLTPATKGVIRDQTLNIARFGIKSKLVDGNIKSRDKLTQMVLIHIAPDLYFSNQNQLIFSYFYMKAYVVGTH